MSSEWPKELAELSFDELMKDDSTWPKMLDELLNDDSDKMSAWEAEFIESLNRQCDGSADGGWCPSPKQEAVLEKIWNKVFD